MRADIGFSCAGMTEAALILIHALGERSGFVGCGVLVEGGYVATCRHVWRDATAGGGAEAEFPRIWGGEKRLRAALELVDPCTAGTGPPIDLVLLKAKSLPSGVVALQLAMHDRFETGDAQAQAMVARPREDGVDPWLEVTVDGTLRDGLGPDGRRQFSGVREQGYWFVRGSSGSPIFKRGGQQLAAILSLSELGVNERRSTLQEAFAIPATAVRRHVERISAAPAARAAGIDPAQLAEVLQEIGAADTPVTEIPARLTAFVAAARARAADPLPPSNDGADIAVTLGTARDKLGRLDTAGALAALSGKLAEEEAARRQRMVPLLAEKAAIERLTYDHAAAQATLVQLLDLAPDAVWHWIDLGDLHVTTGDLRAALATFRAALAAARRVEPGGRDESVAHNRIGDVQRAQGDLGAALRSYRDALAIAGRLAGADPGNAEWQRDLSVSHNKIGDVQMAQGDLAAALRSYRDALTIAERLAGADPGNAGWQRDFSISYERIGDVQRAQGDLAAALRSFRDALAIRERLAGADLGNAEWQRDLSVGHTKIGDVQMAQGDLAAALRSYRDALAIAERLAGADPGNAEWQRDMIVSCVKLAEAAPQEARAWLSRAQRIARDLAASGRLAPVDAWMPANLERRLAALGD